MYAHIHTHIHSNLPFSPFFLRLLLGGTFDLNLQGAPKKHVDAGLRRRSRRRRSSRRRRVAY